jgi:hypothetical protein
MFQSPLCFSDVQLLVITAIIHVCQAPFDHGLDVVLCLVVYPVDIVAKTEGDIWLFSP